MNSEYAYNRDKGKCKICGDYLQKDTRFCHHIKETLLLTKVNKVINLAWLHKDCHKLLHLNIPLTSIKLYKKIITKIDTFRKKFYNIEYHSDKGNVCEDIDDRNLREIKA